MISFWESIIKGLNFFSKKESEDKPEHKPDFYESDFIDYDGMGNQGRFVSVKKNKNK